MNYLIKETNCDNKEHDEELEIVGSCEDNCDYITILGREIEEGEELWFVKASSEEQAIEFCFECGTYIAKLA